MTSRLIKFLLVFAIGFIAAGCAPAHFSLDDTPRKIESFQTIGIVSPDIRVYEVSPSGGVFLEKESSAASSYAAEAMMEFFKGTRLKVKVIGPDFKTRKEFLEVQALSKAVHKNLREFWDPMQQVTPPTLGSLEGLSDFYQVEGFIFMDGLEVHKEEKSALSKSLVKLAVGAVYGPSALPRQGRSKACISLAETSGTVIWAGFRDSEIAVDENFKDREAARRLVRKMLAGFPRN